MRGGEGEKSEVRVVDGTGRVAVVTKQRNHQFSAWNSIAYCSCFQVTKLLSFGV